jgi:hypothetical protein
MKLNRPLTKIEITRIRREQAKAQNRWTCGGVLKTSRKPRPIMLRSFEKSEPKPGAQA